MAMVRVGTKMYDTNQTFMAEIDSVAGPVELTAAQAAAMWEKSNVYSRGNTTQAGMLQKLTPNEAPKQEAPAPAPAAPRPSAPRSVLSPSAPPPAPLNQQVTQKERDEVTKPAKGLENTIKTTPTLLREKRRKSYLTAGG